MPENYNMHLPAANYRAALLEELRTPNISREHKAAIVEQLEWLGPRTADEDRAAVEAATLGPVTVGRAASNDVAQVVEVPVEVDGERETQPVPSTTGSVPVTAGEGGN